MKYSLPKPKCCDKIGEEYWDGQRAIYPAVPGYGFDPKNPVAPEWKMAHSKHPVLFCPFCGTKLPEFKLKKNAPKRRMKITDGGYYCDTCSRRLTECRCCPPEGNFEV